MQANQPATRRQFSKLLAAMAGAGATAAVPATALASPEDDRELLRLEEEIFDACHATYEHDDEIARLEKILRDKSFEFHVLVDENRRHIVCSMPEYEPYDRLVTLRIQHSTRMCDLIDRMWTIPAHTEAGCGFR
jgi:hypothetical protein